MSPRVQESLSKLKRYRVNELDDMLEIAPSDAAPETVLVMLSDVVALLTQGEPAEDGWTPFVLTEYEIGRAVLSAQIIARSEKPITEVGCQKVASIAALHADLKECIRLAGHADHVRMWTRPTDGGRTRYGFYREPWVLDALDFLDRAELPDTWHAGLSGLLFGYRTNAIEEFIDRMAGVDLSQSTSPAPTPARPTEPGWLPIETAPKNHLHFGWLPTLGLPDVIEYCDGEWTGTSYDEKPTHWMPLPVPPPGRLVPDPLKGDV